MIRRVAKLEGALVDQIAAGEVVERPSSAAKELLENSLDAGARSITIDIEDGGKGRLRIADDGSGMDREDALLAIERHATSKLRTVEDLAAIHTLGFRGEALPSIASVSKFTLTTRSATSESGTMIRIEGGNVVEVRDAGTAIGTIIDVESLFYNVPARLKFLKSKSTEAGAIYDVALRVALAHPELRLVVRHDGRVIHTYLPVRDLEERARTALGDVPLSPVAFSSEGIKVRACLSAPERARNGARGLHLFVNGRPVLDAKLARAVSFGYGSVLPPGRYPLGVMHLEVPADEVDVNAHPQKSEVRFARGAALYEAISRGFARELGTKAFSGPDTRGPSYWDTRLGGKIAVTERAEDVAPYANSTLADSAIADSGLADFAKALLGHGPSPAASNRLEAALGAPSQPSEVSKSEFSASGFRVNESAFTRTPPPAPSPYEEPAPDASLVRDSAEKEQSSTPTLPSLGRRGYYASLRFVGQVRKTFLLCESDSGLLILDQHAVDERIVYHRLRKGIAARRVDVERLLFPERLELDRASAELVEKESEALADFGLECRRLGETTVSVHTVPALLRRAQPRRLLEDLLAELSLEGERNFGDALDTAVATMACHAAIRAGDLLSPAECMALLASLDEVDAFAGHCPHGRPVVTTLLFADLEKKLGR